jgi:steroid delta-isomerase-like uncharacterized protein
MSSDDNKALVRRLFEEGVNQRHYEVVDELVAPDFVLHSALMGEVRGRAAYKQGVVALLEPAPDLRATIEDLIAGERETIIARLTYRGTDTGGFVRGHPATGKGFEFTAIYIWRLAEGQVTELWQEADRVRLLQQLGIIPS